MIQHNYTVTLDTALKDTTIDIAQVTLNHLHGFNLRTSQVYNLCLNRKKAFIIHWDFINIPTKWNLFSKGKQQSILKELQVYHQFQQKYPQFLGIVFHTNSSLDTRVLKSKDTFNTHYKYSTYDLDSFWQRYSSFFDNTDKFILQFQLDSMNQFLLDSVVNHVDLPVIFFENNTRSSSNYFNYSSILDWLKDKNKNLGICYDTEHEYAQTGKPFKDIKEATAEAVISGHPFIIHYNVIPEGIVPGCLKDKHSFNDISQCDYMSVEEHLNNMQWLSDNNIPFIREVKDDTRLREEQLRLILDK